MRISDWSSDVCSSDLESLFRIATPISSDVLKAVFQVHGIDAADGSFGLVGKSVQQPAAFAQIVQPRTAVHEYIETDQRPVAIPGTPRQRSEEHPSELQSLMRISYAVFCLKQKTQEH